MSPNARWWLAGAGAGLVALIAYTTYETIRVRRAPDLTDVATKWERLRRCLFHAPPDPAEPARWRLRDIELQSPKLPDGRQWPQVCQPLAKELRAALEKAQPPRAASAPARARWAEVDRGCAAVIHDLSDAKLPSSDGTSRFLAVASSLPQHGDLGVVVNAPVVSPIPRRFTPLPLPRGVGPDEWLRRDGMVTLGAGPSSGTVCRFLPTTGPERLTRARCEKVLDTMPRPDYALRVVPSEDQARTLLLLDLSKKVLDLATGHLLLDAAHIHSAWVRRDGTVIALAEQRGPTVLDGIAVAAPEREPTFTPLRDPVEWRLLVGESLFELRKGKPPVLGVRLADGTAPEDLGAFLGTRTPEPQVCVTEGHWFASFESGDHQVVLARRKGGKWKLLSQRSAPGYLSCHLGKAHFAALAARVVTITTCSLESCDSSTATLPAWNDGATPAGERGTVVVALGERVLAVEANLGLRLRLARLNELPKAPERVFFDNDPLKEGFLVHSQRLLARGNAAVLVLHTAEGTFALRIDEQGEVKPVVAE